MKITIKDIAQLAGVSTTTVSKILNNKDESISEGTRARVKQIMQEHNYTPNNIARTLVTKRSYCIGVVIPDIRNTFFPELIRGIEDTAHQLNYNLIICNTDDDIQKQNKYLDILHKRMVDGIILTASQEEQNQEIFNSNLPLVLVDRDIPIGNPVGKIMVDNQKGGYMATSYLADKGCKNIVFLSGTQNSVPSKDRYLGYLKAMAEHGLNADKMEHFGNFKSEFGLEKMQQLLKQGQKVDGVFCASDVIAIGAIKAIKEFGLRVPQDIKVVGFDDIYFAQYLEPPLTTIAQPIYEIGATSARLLIDYIEDKTQDKDQVILLDTKLVERESALEGL